MPDDVRDLWKFAPVVAVLVAILWAGHKGFWYWGPSTRMMIEKIERERDEWKRLAYALMEKSGLSIPADLLPDSTSFKKKENGK
jgi:hypothetical protein